MPFSISRVWLATLCVLAVAAVLILGAIRVWVAPLALPTFPSAALSSLPPLLVSFGFGAALGGSRDFAAPRRALGATWIALLASLAVLYGCGSWLQASLQPHLHLNGIGLPLMLVACSGLIGALLTTSMLELGFGHQQREARRKAASPATEM